MTIRSMRFPIHMFAFICAFCPSLIAGESAQELLERLQTKYQSIRDASITFTQHALFAITKAEQSFDGKLLMKKGNKYRIEMEQQLIITDGSIVWTYSKLNNQVIIDRYKDDPRSFTPDKVLMTLSGNYTAANLGTESFAKREFTILKLTPKAPRSGIRWMKVWVDEEELLMRKVQVADRSENIMTYTLGSITSNEGLVDSLFRFAPPPGAEIIDLR